MALDLAYGDPFYYTDEYKTIIRSCKEMILTRASYRPFVTDTEVYAYRNNFHKLIRATAGISEDLVWTIAFINGITNPHQDFSHLKGFYVVDRSIISTFVQVTRVVRE